MFRFRTAQFLGSTGGRRLNARVIAMAPTFDGFGYWLVGEDGGVFTFGTARFRGSAAGAGTAPVVGIAHD